MRTGKLYTSFVAHLLLICIGVSVTITCPNRKPLATETQVSSVLTTATGTVNSQLSCLNEITTQRAEKIWQTGANQLPATGTLILSLNLLLNVPGTTIYLPPVPDPIRDTNPLPLFLKNGVLIV